LIGVGIIATFTRAGLLAMATAILGIATLRVCRLAFGSTAPDVGTGVRGLARRWGAREPATLVALTAVLASCFFVAHTPELLAARLTTEGARWYGARYEVPSALQMSTAEHHRVRVTVVNTGRLTWDPHGEPPFALSYHWLMAGGAVGDAVIEFEGQRTPFPGAVTPGQRIELLADVIAPGAPGTYTLVWDVVHERRAWLSTEGVASARSTVTVSGDSRTATTTPRRQLPAAIVRPSRPALWSAALDMARDHPWLGVGPDNYRLASERYLGTAFFDSRVHANNMYLEVLAGAGVPGLLALLWLTAATGLALARRVRDAARDTHTAAVAAFALWMVIAGHGLVDSFLAFTPTYVSFAVAGGWSLSPGLAGGEPHAHRV
jgi:hypothetical protein